MGISRREFFRIAGLSTVLGLGGKAALELVFPGQADAEYGPRPGGLVAKKWAMVIDMRKMDAATAKKCVAACHRLHNVPDFRQPNDPKDALDSEWQGKREVKWIWTENFEHSFVEEHDYLSDKLHHMQFLLLCNHCENPPCVRVCPTKATFKRPDGIVMMDMHRCIGCRFCMAGCPFGARSFNWRDPRPFIKEINEDYPTREAGVVEKCTFCAERLAIGKLPACVEASGGALLFGDASDPKSKVRDALRNNYSIRRKIHLGTNPQVYYLV